MSVETIFIPDLGSTDDVEIIEVNVVVGEQVETDQTMMVLESDKTTMDIPATFSGKIKELLVNVGDKVSSGSPMLSVLMEPKAQVLYSTETIPEAPSPSQQAIQESTAQTMMAGEKSTPVVTIDSIMCQSLRVPDIGTVDAVSVIEVNVKVGDEIEKDQTLMVLESDKTTMDIPAEFSGVLKTWLIKEGDEITGGTLMGTVDVPDLVQEKVISADTLGQANSPSEQAMEKPTESAINLAQSPAPNPLKSNEAADTSESERVYAGPAVRRLAREMGVLLQKVKGTAPKGRICKDDIKSYVKNNLNKPAPPSHEQFSLPAIDFSQFGEVQSQPLNRIKQATARNMSSSWRHVPMVTHFEQSDITELEHYRREILPTQIEGKMTMLAFVVKAVVHALQKFPQFNSSLDADGKNLIIKKYMNVGVAVETPQGLMVPVIKGADQKNLLEIAQQITTLAKQARDKKLPMDALQGGGFSISSLGGIGGTQFTPIVNAPEVAILGLSRASLQPVYDQTGKGFVPRLMLPMALTYDHRVIDGAEAARFMAYLAGLLKDIRHLLL